MTVGSSDDIQADYTAAWKALPRRERADLTQAALKGQRSVNRWDAAITLWWVQRELRYGVRNALLTAVAVVAVLLVLAWVVDGVPPTSFGNVLRAVPLLPVFLLIPIATTGMRRPRLRIAAQLNASVLAGKTFDGPPDPEEAERLLRRARKEGWFRGTRPER
jgi:hypothetical protein